MRLEFLGWWRKGQKPRKTVGQLAGMTTRAGWRVLEEISTEAKVELINYLMGQSNWDGKKILDLEKGIGRKIGDKYLESQAKAKWGHCECRSEVEGRGRGWGLVKDRIFTPNVLSGSAVNTLCTVITWTVTSTYPICWYYRLGNGGKDFEYGWKE